VLATELPGAAVRVREAVQRRGRPALTVAGGDADASSVTGSMYADGSSLASLGLQQAYQLALAGDRVDLHDLREFLSERALDLAEPLQKDHEHAFAAGLAGTVVGLGAQVYIAGLLAQNPGFNQTFFTGVVLKASCTFVGLLVAVYARSLRSTLLARYTSVIDEICMAIAVHIAPLAQRDKADARDPESLINRVSTLLEEQVRTLGESLTTTLSGAIQSAQTSLKAFVSEDLAPAVGREIVEPFATAIGRHTTAIGGAEGAIAAGAQVLSESTVELGARVGEALIASKRGAESLDEVCTVVKHLGTEFDAVALRANEAAREFRRSCGELERVLQVRPDRDGFAELDRFTAELLRCAVAMREGHEKSSELLTRAVAALDRTSRPQKH
jgi:hypothetical protein